MNTNLLSLLQLSDPALPIGGYAHSGGLETYVQEGLVSDPLSAGAFVREMLRTSLHYTDAALVALSYEAVRRREEAGGPKGLARLLELDRLCEAVKLPKEIREGSRKLGGRLLKIFGEFIGTRGEVLNVRDPEAPGDYVTLVRGKRTPGHYTIAFGYCAAMLGIELQEALTGFYYNAAAGMITNCVKLIPMGQQDGQELLFSLHPLIMELTEKSLAPDRELIGLCCTGLDIRCMQHERLYSRLYMS